MRRSTVRWLYDELPQLVRRGIIDADAAARIRDHYGPAPGSDARRLLLAVFGVLGALLVGAGVVLVLAHNWEELSRPTRAGLAIGLLLVAQTIAGWAMLRRRASTAWIEATSGALVLAVVATLALISQTYQLSDDPRRMLLVWGLLIAPIPYLTGSRVAAASVWAIACGWLMSQGWWESIVDVRGFALLTATTVPFLVYLGRHHAGGARSAIVGWAIGLSCVIAIPRIADTGVDGMWIPLMTGFLGTLLVAGRFLETRGDAARSWSLRPWTTTGTIGLAFVTFVLGFRDLWGDLHDLDLPGETGVLGFTVRAAFALALVGFAATGAVRAVRGGDRTAEALLAVPVWATLGWLAMLVTPTSNDSAVLTVVVVAHLAALAIGVTACIEGMRVGALGRANAGLLMIAAVATARFFDADLTFVVRGVAFILVGSGFLALNVWLLRRRRESTS